MKKLKIITMILMLIVLFKMDIVQAENIYKEYKIGDKITYNGMEFYVIDDSNSKKNYVTLLKSTPLTEEEVNTYGGVGTANNHVNMYAHPSDSFYQKANPWNNTGGMAYYTSETCGYELSGNLREDGCKNDYESSEVKYVVDAWTQEKLNASDLVKDSLGYKTRLITLEELINNLGYEQNDDQYYPNGEKTPSWVDIKNYYWTMSKSEIYSDAVEVIHSGGMVGITGVRNSIFVVRPVINLKKEPVEKKKLTDKEFKIGDIVEYNNMLFYVIKNSTEKDTSVTLLKAEPLTVDEVNEYGGVGTKNNHVNMHVTIDINKSYYRTAENINGYGGMVYYSSKKCGNDSTGNYSETECTTNYDSSEIKYVVDAWVADKVSVSDLTEDSFGYKARILNYNDLINDLGYTKDSELTFLALNTKNTPSWVYNSNYSYWTMSTYEDSSSRVWYLNEDGSVNNYTVCSLLQVVRPVITLKKINEDNSEESKVEKEKDNDSKDEVIKGDKTNQIVSVPDTLLNNPVSFVVIGGNLIIVGSILFVLFNKKNKFNKK